MITDKNIRQLATMAGHKTKNTMPPERNAPRFVRKGPGSLEPWNPDRNLGDAFEVVDAIAAASVLFHRDANRVVWVTLTMWDRREIDASGPTRAVALCNALIEATR